MKSIMMVMAFGAIGVAIVHAAPLAGQAGSATTSRAMVPEKVVSARQTKSVEPKVEAPKASARDAVKIGVIDKVVLVGLPDFIREQEVESLIAPAICDGTVKTVGDVKAALSAAKAALIARGYYLTYINVSRGDAYDQEKKSLELRVEPGRFGKIGVTMKDGNWYSAGQVGRRFKRIEEDAPFNYFELRQALRELNGHPDLMADTKLSVRNIENDSKTAPTGIRYLDTELTVEDSFPFHATMDINNYAMEELGYWQMLMSLQYLNLTGADDILTVSPGVTFNGEMWSIAGSYMRPFDVLRGGNWSLFGGYSDMNCDDIVQRMDLEGIGGFAGLNTQWYLWDTERRNLAFNLGIMWRLIRDQWEAQNQPLTRRDLQIVPITVGLSYGDKRRDWLGGLDFFSLSDTFNIYGDKALFNSYASDEAQPNYTVLRASWARLQPLVGPSADGEEWRCWSLFQKIEGQSSLGCTLISAERLAYGGFNCLRGYRTRGYLGDSGIYGTTELRTPVWCNPVSKLIAPELESVIERIQLAVFSDYGWVSYQEPQNGSMTKDEFLWSAGFGVRFALTKYFSVNFDFAVPLRDCYAKDKDRDLELYFSIKLQY